jgi:hypothetical protein
VVAVVVVAVVVVAVVVVPVVVGVVPPIDCNDYQDDLQDRILHLKEQIVNNLRIRRGRGGFQAIVTAAGGRHSKGNSFKLSRYVKSCKACENLKQRKQNKEIYLTFFAIEK